MARALRRRARLGSAASLRGCGCQPSPVFVLLAFLLAAGASAQSPGQDRQIDVGEANLSVTTWGEGAPVVLLPGAGISTALLEALAPHVAAGGLRVIAVNPRGIGGSTGNLTGLTMRDYADDLAELVRELGLGQVHVAGWAWGNRWARSFAVYHPNLVKSVTLLAAGGLVPPDPEAVAAQTRLGQPDLSPDERLDAIHTRLFAPASDPSLWLEGILAESWPEGRRAQGEANRATPVDTWWSGGNAPMLVVQGLQDRIAPPGNGRALKEDYPDRVRLVELDDAGHALVLEQPEAVADALVQFTLEHD